jgi:hypothetical protein
VLPFTSPTFVDTPPGSMKLLRTNVRVNPRDSLGQGLDAVITLVLFFGAGFFADRWLGTTPLLMIVLTLLGGVGVFYKIKGGYEAKMAEHETERLARKADRAAAAEQAAAAESTGPAGP